MDDSRFQGSLPCWTAQEAISVEEYSFDSLSEIRNGSAEIDWVSYVPISGTALRAVSSHILK